MFTSFSKRGNRTITRVLARLLVVGLAGTGSLALTTHTAGASTVYVSGAPLAVTYQNQGSCQYSPTWAYAGPGLPPYFNGAKKSATVLGPTVRNPNSTARTVYYRAILVDQRTGAFAAQSNYASYYLVSGASVKFGNLVLNVPWAADIHNHVVGLEVWAYQGNTAVTHDLLRIDTYRIYGLSSLGVADGAYSSYC